jgi:hypothetical protein
MKGIYTCSPDEGLHAAFQFRVPCEGLALRLALYAANALGPLALLWQPNKLSHILHVAVTKSFVPE